ncbi:MAG: hypothetical protein JST45_03740, partial [Bacteroidetes bacterium]|nr:hypothetical protein [Bacteroidota bacterium]
MIRPMRAGSAIQLIAAIALGAAFHQAKGQAYFQQEVDYVIDVRLDDESHLLHGSETFTYRNNSTSTLDTLWIHLWPNAYRDRNTALCRQKDSQNDFDLHFAEAEERGWIDSLDFHVGAAKLQWDFSSANSDIAWLKLPQPLVPGGHTVITTPFRVKIPDAKFSRL